MTTLSTLLAMNMLAQELNERLAGTIADRLMSKLGKRLYFPKGIIMQSAEAKELAQRANSTIGMAYQSGQPLILTAITDSLPTLSAAEAVSYQPTAGVDSLRTAWREAILSKNPAIEAVKISLPAVVPGLTAGISYVADLFLDEGTEIVVSDPSWDNYGLIFCGRRGATTKEIPFFGNGAGLNLKAIERGLRETAATGTVRLILNFPHNPSGYSPTRTEAEHLISLIKELADAGCDLLVICDDAYYGLNYEADIYPQSLFGTLAKLHERVLAVKIDGPTKEDYVWGFRLGFVTFGSAGLSVAAYEALERKLLGVIRSSVSCSSSPGQFLMLKSSRDPRTSGEKARFQALLKERYDLVKAVVTAHADHPVLKPLPFNSGYFMSFVCRNGGAEKLRRALLSETGIGTIAFGDKYLRIAFSSVDSDKLADMYLTIFDMAARLLD